MGPGLLFAGIKYTRIRQWWLHNFVNIFKSLNCILSKCECYGM